jgi:O-acetyl-ADP-ribose deacetylase (regulator of RNase III)
MKDFQPATRNLQLKTAKPMTEHTHAGVTLQLTQGDIAAQTDIEAVVNAANAQLISGGGVAGAIHRAAGRGLAEEARPMGPIQPGEVVLTGAHELPNDHVLHALGPVHGRSRAPSDELLARCYRDALRLADEHEIVSVAFPALSTGAFGYPMEEAAHVAFQAVRETLPELDHVRTVRFVLYDADALDLHERVAGDVFGA